MVARLKAGGPAASEVGLEAVDIPRRCLPVRWDLVDSMLPQGPEATVADSEADMVAGASVADTAVVVIPLLDPEVVLDPKVDAMESSVASRHQMLHLVLEEVALMVQGMALVEDLIVIQEERQAVTENR